MVFCVILYHFTRVASSFEEGIRTKLNDELDDLKEQQRHFSDSLEHLIDETHNLEDQL